MKLLLQKPADQSRQTELAKFVLSSFSFPIKEKKSHDYLWIKSLARPDRKVLFEVVRARTEGLPVIPRHPYNKQEFHHFVNQGFLFFHPFSFCNMLKGTVA